MQQMIVNPSQFLLYDAGDAKRLCGFKGRSEKYREGKFIEPTKHIGIMSSLSSL